MIHRTEKLHGAILWSEMDRLPPNNGTETTLAACPEAEVQALSAAIVAGKGEK